MVPISIAGKGAPYRIGEELHLVNKETDKVINLLWIDHIKAEKLGTFEQSLMKQLRLTEEGINVKLARMFKERRFQIANQFLKGLKVETTALRGFGRKLKEMADAMEKDIQKIRAVSATLDKHVEKLEKQLVPRYG